MSAFVLDASITLGWCFKDEQTELTAAILQNLIETSAIVPSLWALEVSNILVNSIRKKRLTQAAAMEFVELLENLPIQIDEETASRAFHETLQLSHSQNLTAYDAAYLELAMRSGLPLATKDISLAKAAKEVGIEVLSA